MSVDRHELLTQHLCMPTRPCLHVTPGADTVIVILAASEEDGSVPDRGVGTVIRILRASGRERLELRQRGGRERVLLTYRVLSSHGRQQLVFFQARDLTVI